MGRIDQVKTWGNSRKYTLAKERNDKKKNYTQIQKFTVGGYNVYPKRKINDEVINVNKITIMEPEFINFLLKRKNQRKTKLDDKYNDKIKSLKEDKKPDVAERIAKLKEELARLKAKEDEEYNKETHRSR